MQITIRISDSSSTDLKEVLPTEVMMNSKIPNILHILQQREEYISKIPNILHILQQREEYTNSKDSDSTHLAK